MIGGPSGLNSLRTYREYCPWLNYLEQKLGCPVEMVFADGYTDLLTKMQKKEFDVVIVGPLQYVRAVKIAPYRMVLIEVIRGRSTYRSAIITRKDGGFLSLADLRGKRIAFVDKESASGFLFPSLMLRAAGLSASDYIPAFSGDHHQVVWDVYDRKVHAGAVYASQDGSNAGHDVFNTDPDKLDQLTSLAISADIPGSGLAFLEDFVKEREKLAQLLMDALLDIRSDTAGDQVMKGLEKCGREGSYVRADIHIYENLAQSALAAEEMLK